MILRTRTLLDRIARLLRAQPLPGLLWFAVLVAIGTAVDALTDGDGRYQMFIGLPMIFAQFLLTSALLRGEGLHRAATKPGRAASFVGLGIVTGIAIGLGLMVLILSGLYLYARWSIATPLVVGEGASMGEAMARSWHRTGPASLSIVAALAVTNLPWVAGLLAMIFLYPPFEPAPCVLAFLANALFFASAILDWYLAVAAHALLDGAGEDRPAEA